MFKNQKKLFFVMMALIVAGIFVAKIVFAQVDVGLQPLASTGLSQEDPRMIVAKIIKIILSFLGVVFLALIVYGGFLWMAAGGSDPKNDKARKTLIAAVIGIIIVLSAYAITAFVISRLGEATGIEIVGGLPSGGEEGGVGGEGGATGGANFYVKSFMPNGKSEIYNVQVRVLFNKEVKENSVSGNFIVRQAADSKEVDGKVEVDAAKIIFTPSQKCAENETQFCFDKNTQYEIVVKEGLRSIIDSKITCSASFACSAKFTTGESFDDATPKIYVSYPVGGQSVKANSILLMQAKATDNFGVSSVDFFFDQKKIGADQPKIAALKEFDAAFDFDLTGAALGKHFVSARAFDLAANFGNAPEISFYVKDESCFNAKDEIICGKPECGLCDGGKCDNDSQCATGTCDKTKAVCVDLPIISSVSPAKGAAGNFVTISGKYFDDFGPASKVEFKDAKSAWIKAELGCAAKSWTNNQVVVVVPSAVASGPIKITTKKGYVDATDNDRGWKGDFIYDANVKWPGLCSVTNALGQAAGKYADLVIADGSGFGDSRGDGDNVYFGEFSADISGTWADKKISGVKIPNLQPGKINVKVSNNNVLSNAVSFDILQTAELPMITSISPANGGKGQYVTISGSNFGDTIGQVQFVKEDDPSKIYVAELGCSQGAWNNAQVVVKVSSKIPIANIGKYTVQIVKGEVKSNQVMFEVNSKAVTPGICYVKPANGPAGTKIEISGEEFGASQGNTGRVVFYNDAEVKDGLVWANEKISNIIVPQTAKSGPVYVLSSAGLKSNEVNFSVGLCTANSCAAGQTCCNGLCLPADECKAAGLQSCEYAWMFSTGLLPIYPEVLEIPVCSKDYPESPSPFKNLKNACPNAETSAIFNTMMDTTSFVNNVIVSACNSQKDDCNLANCSKEGANCHNLALKDFDNPPFEFRVVKYLGDDRTQLVLKTKLQTNLKYRVTLLSGAKGIKSQSGLAMMMPYFWEFATGNASCSVDHILVSPSKALLDDVGKETKYVAQCVAKNCNTVTCPTESEWKWGFSDADYAAPRAMLDWDVDENFSTAKALAETNPDKDIEIYSVFKSYDEKQPGEYSDTADLQIKFAAPQVIDFYPACFTACPSSLVFAKFNTSMLVKNDWQNKVIVLPCLSQACTTFTAAGQIAGDASYDSETKTVNFVLQPGAFFVSNTYYRVIIDGDIKSEANKALTELNYDENNDGKIDSYSWIFKTKDDSAVCKPQKVNVIPQKMISYDKAQKILYQASPIGDPLGCDGVGEILAPNLYSWTWDSLKPSVAIISTDQRNLNLPKYCNAKCLLSGSVPKDQAAICGNGKIEYGEECDDSNKLDGDGCNSKCLNEGSVACLKVDDANCCGNGIKDKAEDCDDKNAKSADGCSSKCLNEGSTIAGFICGNGKIEYGEDCDDKNVLAKDGCNSQCLFEGAQYVVGAEPMICGNGKLDVNEECEMTDAGCSKNCLWQGTLKCSKAGEANCCGNAKIDVGEECEIYDVWCAQNCLKQGADYSWGAVCGNGKVEPGEDAGCEPAIDESAPGNFYQLATVVGALPEKVFVDSTNILAYPWDINATAKILQAKDINAAELIYTTLGYENGPTDGKKGGEGESPTGCKGYGEVAFVKTSPVANATNVCSNASILLEFNQPLNLDSLAKKITVTVVGAQMPPAAATIKSWQDASSSNTKVLIEPIGLLTSNKAYFVTVANGVIDSCGKATTKPLAIGFTVDGACKVVALTIDPATKIFTKPAEEQEFVAIAQAEKDYIHEVVGQYEWTITWKLPESSKDIVGIKPSSKNPSENIEIAFAKDKEGQDNLLYAVLEISADALFGGIEIGKGLEAAANIDVIFCDKFWMWNANKYFGDPKLDFGKFNLQMFYCRDGKSKEDALDDLPLIKDVAGSVNKTQSPMIFYEVFFVRETGPYGAPQADYDYVSDAMSLRIAENPGAWPLELWYKQYVPNPGGPQSMDVDGYHAIKDGRTMYVSGANVSDDKKIFNNVYIFSYTDKANANSLAIVNQLLNNWKFNTNVEVLKKQMIQRDTKRVNDAAFVKYLLNDSKNPGSYFKIYADYPHLDAGSYVKNVTYSMWPSWQEEFGADLQNSLPEDPLNHFADVAPLNKNAVMQAGVVDEAKYQACGDGYCEKSKSQCLETNDLCRLCPIGYDVNTCYDSLNKKFYSQSGKYQPVYSYKYLPAAKQCQFNYYLETEALLAGYKFEFKPEVCK
ncbi:Ig-like domain-containing protein [Candidatus Falkowbacteria bacterium]|nr:Ig-like domain-containing protein [Candidatus Falkowbacteria bacterium]